ncbi:GntR family transcriptional regulator [Fodinibacter luteus]|uniref:GntR family transcriptional regulator n=1 Tax=Fodinibacter luteus TaxID=552064 RepID=A0ABP8KP03_9MICO
MPTVPSRPRREPHRITDGVEPKHVQLRSVLATMAATELLPDSAIPSERELMERFAVSRATVRRAIEALIGDGVLQRVQGKGTFVAPPRVRSHLHLASFTRDMRRRGLSPSTRVVRVEAAAPPDDVARWFGLAPGAPAWRVERVRLAAGEPMAFERGWYSPELLPGLDRHDLAASLHELFAREYSRPVDSAEQSVRAEVADAALAHHLEVRVGDPILAVDRSSRSEGAPLERVLSHYRGDRYELYLSLGDTVPGNPQHHPRGGNHR